MRSIGFRVTPKCVYYCVIEEKDDSFDIIANDKIIVPTKMEIPYQLRFIKTNVFSIIKEFNIEKVGIRATENNARSISIPRIYMEGVIIESIEGSSVKSFFIGTINKIASLINEESKAIKRFIDNDVIFKGIKDWNTYSSEVRESIITAVAASNL